MRSRCFFCAPLRRHSSGARRAGVARQRLGKYLDAVSSMRSVPYQILSVHIEKGK
jgi:hypothetical protein